MRRDGNDNRERVHGPYEHRNRWRVCIVAADGSRRYRSFETEAKARKYVAIYREETDERTVSAAVDLYVAHLRDPKGRGLRETTVTTVEYRLDALLETAARDRALRLLTPAAARTMFERRAAVTSVDTQVGELSAARGFATYCVKQGWLRVDPFDGLEPTGQKRRGKLHLRIDEARRFLDHALAEESNAGLAAAMALLMGLRASEVTDRVVRDVDDGARVLWIDRAKTRAGRRHLEIPETLRARVAALIEGRDPTAPLWGDVDRHWLGYHVRRISTEARVPVVTPHGLRGTFADLATVATPVEHVAKALGHTGPSITRRHYLGDGIEHAENQRTTLRVLAGGVGNSNQDRVSHDGEKVSA